LKHVTRLLLFSIFSVPFVAYSLPIDFGGELGFDTLRVSNSRRTKSSSTTDPGVGSEQIQGSSDTAYIQSYLFKLNPTMVVNDHVTVKGEITTGKGRGGRMGEGGYVAQQQGMGHAHYYHTTANQDSTNNLNLNQIYMEIYSETATYKVGRFSRHWGLGAMINNGESAWDRFFTYYEGAEAVFGLGKLYITPSWSNISNNEKLSHDGEIKDVGLSLLYDNPDKDTKFGVYLGKRKTNGNPIYTANAENSNSSTSATTITSSSSSLLDFFMSRYWGDFYLGAEVPYLYGDLGNLNGTKTDMKGVAIIVDSSYQINEQWKAAVTVGKIDGEEGKSGRFSAVYLHPNFQVAELMFRYNWDAVSASSENIYESSITNTSFLKFGAVYKKALWDWNFSWIYAQADSVAKSGSRAFQHENGYHFTAAADQSKDLGHEFDLKFNYQWNPNLVLSGIAAYYMVGDYYAFTNTGTSSSVSNQFATGLKLDLKF
jgi:hypothetical protein